MNTLTTFTDSRLAHAVESRHSVQQSARWFSPTVLEIVTLYDEEGAREAGKNLCHRLNAQLGPRYAIHLLPWKFSVTQFPMLTDIVVRETTRGPFLLVTIRAERAVTPEVETFIRRCAAGMRRAGAALVVQLHGIAKDQKASSPVYQCLARIAEESNIPFFSTVVVLNQSSRGAGRASPSRSGSPFVAIPPQTLPLVS
ncbi:MAG TPA: hypothetical protein VL171_14450 [Verrucomicrobiae bacterium]|nr:hypothetical protein [Verrucomicrobiae bacterium]